MRWVNGLLYGNIAISLLLAALTFLFYGVLVDFQTAHLLAGQADPTGEVRSVVEHTTWIRPVAILLVSLLYLRIAAGLRAGRRSSYVRILVIGVLGSIGLGYVVFSGQYPVWMAVVQSVQVLVLLSLLVAITRPAVRARFARKTVTA